MKNPKVQSTNRFAFTKPTVEALKPKDRQYYAWDEDEHGLCVLVMPSGVKTFFYRYKVEGRSKRFRIGRFPDVSAGDAQRKTVIERGRVADGKDPVEANRERRKEMLVSALLNLYKNDHLRTERKPRAVVAAEQLTKDYLAPLVGLKLSDLNRKRVAEWHVRASQRSKSQANRALEVLSAACSFALLRDLAPVRWVGVNPCHGVRANREVSRSRFLSPVELGRLLRALDVEPEDLRDFFKMLLYTGARRSNVQAMRWADLDLDGGSWRIGASESKSGEAMSIPLVEDAVTILRRRKAECDALILRVEATSHVNATGLTLRQASHRAVERRKASHAATFVFPGRGATGHLIEPKTAWARILKRAKIEDLHVHDLRRTMGSWLAGQGANAFVIQKALGHRSLAATQVYARLDLAPVREAMQTVATAFAQAGANAEADEKKVVKITRKR